MEECKNIKLLVIDDEDITRRLFAAYFADSNFIVLEASGGVQGIDIFRQQHPDIVVTDLMMPDIGGLEVVETIARESSETPVIVVSGTGIIEDSINAVRNGAWDYVMKPISDISELKHVISKALERSQLLRENRRYREGLEQEVKDRTMSLRMTNEALNRKIDESRHAREEIFKLHQELEGAQREVIFILGAVVESRSQETSNHVRRIGDYSYLLAKKIGLTDDEAELVRLASPMHDVGKIGIPDAILNKPAALTSEEFACIKKHTTIGYNILKASERVLLKVAAIIALQHHERWGGGGYPSGLQGEEIHLYGRIVAIADVFDALSHNRVYKEAWPVEDVFTYILEQRGQQFDPELVDIMIANKDEILALRQKYTD